MNGRRGHTGFGPRYPSSQEVDEVLRRFEKELAAFMERHAWRCLVCDQKKVLTGYCFGCAELDKVHPLKTLGDKYERDESGRPTKA